MPGFPRATVFQLNGKERMLGRGAEDWFKLKSRRKWSTMVSSLAALSSCTPRQLERVLCSSSGAHVTHLEILEEICHELRSCCWGRSNPERDTGPQIKKAFFPSATVSRDDYTHIERAWQIHPEPVALPCLALPTGCLGGWGLPCSCSKGT